MKKILSIDRFTLALIGTVLLASVFPARGAGQTAAQATATLAVALLFFLHGVKLSPRSLWAGLTQWRLHLLIIISTFVVFPLLALLLKPFSFLVGREFYSGFLFLSILPSTVQSSIAFTSMAKGNVPAAVCAASASSLLGIVLTPFLAGLVLQTAGAGFSLQALRDICLQLLLPFLLGQMARPWLAGWVGKRKKMVGLVDHLSILTIVFSAFSESVVMGLWKRVDFLQILGLVFFAGLLLALIMLFTSRAAKFLKFNREDSLTILFCGSKKSLATGVPMAGILFSPQAAGAMIVPVMIFHQIQLMVCAVIAGRASKEVE